MSVGIGSFDIQIHNLSLCSDYKSYALQERYHLRYLLKSSTRYFKGYIFVSTYPYS